MGSARHPSTCRSRRCRASQGPNAALACILFGTTTAFTPERIAELYPSRADYEQRYAASADTVIDQGFVLPVDRDRLLDYADPSAVAP